MAKSNFDEVLSCCSSELAFEEGLDIFESEDSIPNSVNGLRPTTRILNLFRLLHFIQFFCIQERRNFHHAWFAESPSSGFRTIHAPPPAMIG